MCTFPCTLIVCIESVHTNFFFASKLLETEVYLIRQSCVHLKNHAITPRQHERKERTETPKHRWQSTTMGRKSTTNAAPSAGAKRSSRISSYYQPSSGSKEREIKKEMIAGATPPPKQTRKLLVLLIKFLLLQLQKT